MAQEFERYLAGLRSQSGGRAENEEVSKGLNPQRETRPRFEIERHPDYFQRRAEAENRSNWSGANWGGRSRG